jgi:ABC-type sugar transport system substrate-binding protein
MGSTRSTGIALVAGVALSLTVAACGGSDNSSGSSSNGGSSASSTGGKSVGVMIKGLDNPFFAAMNDGVKAAGKSTGSNVRVQAAASLDDTSGQASKLEALIGQKMSCYVVNPISQTNLVQPLARVPDGTPVVNIDSPVGANAAKQAGLDISTYIGTDNVAAGGMAADTMADLVKGGGTIGVIGGVSGDSTSVARVTGFTKGAQGRFKALTTVAGDWDRAKALNAAEDLMRSNPDIKGFFAANDQMALGIAQAVKNAGKKGQVAIVGVDGIQDALKAVQAGDMSATVSQYPYTIGQLGVEACVAAAQGKKLPANVKAPVQVVTKANVAKAEQKFPEPVNSFSDPFTALIGS